MVGGIEVDLLVARKVNGQTLHLGALIVHGELEEPHDRLAGTCIAQRSLDVSRQVGW